MAGIAKITWYSADERIDGLHIEIIRERNNRQLCCYMVEGIPPLTKDATVYFLRWLPTSKNNETRVSGGLSGEEEYMETLWSLWCSGILD